MGLSLFCMLTEGQPGGKEPKWQTCEVQKQWLKVERPAVKVKALCLMDTAAHVLARDAELVWLHPLVPEALPLQLAHFCPESSCNSNHGFHFHLAPLPFPNHGLVAGSNGLFPHSQKGTLQEFQP